MKAMDEIKIYHVILGLEFLSYPGSIVYGVCIVGCGVIVIIFILNNIIALEKKLKNNNLIE